MNTMPTEKFWMVYGVGQGEPTFKHDTEAGAVDEAKRLARHHNDIPFVVLESKTAVIKREFVTVTLRDRADAPSEPYDDGIPF